MPTKECLFSLVLFGGVFFVCFVLLLFFPVTLQFFSSLIACLVKVRSEYLDFESHEQMYIGTLRGGIQNLSGGNCLQVDNFQDLRQMKNYFFSGIKEA